MSKSDITIEQARSKIDAIAKELGLLTDDKSGFIKVQGPTNKHRLYIQKSRNLNRIDFTVDLPTDDPMYKQMSAPNGSIKCHIVPTLENLERALRMLADSSLGTQVPNKARPFAPTKMPARKPKAVAAPVPAAALKELPKAEELRGRLKVIHERARELRITSLMEKDPSLSRAEAEAQVDERRKAVGLPVPADDAILEAQEVAHEAGLDEAIEDAQEGLS